MSANLETKHSKYLVKLRDSGKTNMFGATPYLINEFPDLDKAQAIAILTEWMETYRAN